MDLRPFDHCGVWLARDLAGTSLTKWSYLVSPIMEKQIYASYSDTMRTTQCNLCCMLSVFKSESDHEKQTWEIQIVEHARELA